MHRPRFALTALLLLLLIACGARDDAPTPTPAPAPTAPRPDAAAPARSYIALDAPLVARAAQAEADEGEPTRFSSGEFLVHFAQDAPGGRIVVAHEGAEVVLILRPLGPELNLLQYVERAERLDDPAQRGMLVAGTSPWGPFTLRLWRYPHNPGLLRYHVEVTPQAELPSGAVGVEWHFVDPATGEEAPANLDVFAERAPFAAPLMYGYSESLDATLLYWLDLTRLNPFIEATRYGPAGTVGRRGRAFGHDLSATDLRKLPQGQPVTLYDGYLYLMPGRPADEDELFRRFLHAVGDVYDLIAKPSVERLPDWRALAEATLRDLDDPDTWVELEGRRYWRAYVSDSRQSAEAITQLDVGLAAARYAARYGDEQAARIAAQAEATLDSFYNPRFGLVQNSGPLAVTGDQGRGDTWYELGHVLKLAEWGLLGSERAADLARRSAAAWIDYAHAVDYRFHRFYQFPNPDDPTIAWQGSEREPDAAGGYAYYMLLLHEMTGEPRFLDEARAAVEALRGNGFGLAYETHMTAQAAAACARLWELTGDERYLTLSYGPVANLVRLAWVWEVDYGPAAEAVTFWGLNPTQQSGVITPKEQYEAWLYLDEYLRRTHGAIDPTVAKLVSEFLKYSLVTLHYSLPSQAPAAVTTTQPAAYPTVGKNRLDLAIPLEDMRDSWGTWGAIGQEVYGAGLAPTLAARAYHPLDAGATLYSGYPPVTIEGNEVTLAGVEPYTTPLELWGASLAGETTTHCGEAHCATVLGGTTLRLIPP